MDFNRLCKGCFREKPQAGTKCPFCGFDELQYEQQRKPEVLPLNTVLRGVYLVGKCLGKGGFGITYIGWHLNLDTAVAIKEFFPAGVVSRDTTMADAAQSMSVILTDSSFAQSYYKALDGFIKEAKTLGSLRLPGVVLVHDCFEENHTAYIVMDYIRGQDVSHYLKQSGGKLDEERGLSLIRPVIHSLQKLHNRGVIHRDISPDNLLMDPDGNITLVDFGAARMIDSETEASNVSRSMTVVLKPGYAPIEQYNTHGNQGPWTDVYALCATLYRIITGETPAESSVRVNRADDEEILRSHLEANHISSHTSDVLIKGMQPLFRNRYQNMRELEDDLYHNKKPESPQHDSSASKQNCQNKPVQERQRKKQTAEKDVPKKQSSKTPQKVSHSEEPSSSSRSSGIGNKLGIIVPMIALLIAAAVIGGIFFLKKNDQGTSETEAYRTTETEKQNTSEAEAQKNSEKESQEASEKLSEKESQEASEKLSEKESQEASEKLSEKESQEASEKKALEEAEAVKTGDIITFGHYEQDNNFTNGEEDIEWIVLDKKDDKALLLSKYGLDAKAYNTQNTGVTWETCDLREWLNDTFYQEAFSAEEQKLIEETTAIAEVNVRWGTEAGNDTPDKIFLLSTSEAETLFSNDNDRTCYPTEYAKTQGAWQSEKELSCWWWLRSPGGNSCNAAFVYYVGTVDVYGHNVNYGTGSVRPALWINLGAEKLFEKKSQEIFEKSSLETAETNIQKIPESVKAGDIITFGHYEQDNNLENGEEEIEWIVLDRKEDQLLVISKYGLDAKEYSTQDTEVTWETCDLRRWLNDTFYREVFSEVEKQQIKETDVINEDNENYGIDAGNDTIDKVFLLSVSEAENLFAEDNSRTCYPTAYTEAQGIWIPKSADTCWWWLRSPSIYGDTAARIRSDGSITYGGDFVDCTYCSVRPAMWINLDAANGQSSNSAGQTQNLDE